ncbi:hypothetical protein L6164_035103 [Bauhinia variegata]|uniref:Uncharacterized protein n=1 Tax=Bauhinia variegata TaxID=167791 RepID=A0ACB9KXC6_BAUVA|nr:hypothetical protein L6164_035103 [Bauhinia variegata]
MVSEFVEQAFHSVSGSSSGCQGKTSLTFNLRPRSVRLSVSCAVEIVMGLEEEFGISVNEDSAQTITTVQEAADLIEEIIKKQSP